MRDVLRAFSVLALTTLGCASAQPNNVPEEPTPLFAKVDVAPSEPSRPPRGALFREDVDKTIQGGLGRFLQRVSVEPKLVQGKFQGWTITDLRPFQFWSEVDLRPGDVVTRINDLPIERETEAFAAFESLRNAQVLRVSYVRAGQPRSLEYKIISRGSQPAPRANPKPTELNAAAPSSKLPARNGR